MKQKKNQRVAVFYQADWISIWFILYLSLRGYKIYYYHILKSTFFILDKVKNFYPIHSDLMRYHYGGLNQHGHHYITYLMDHHVTTHFIYKSIASFFRIDLENKIMRSSFLDITWDVIKDFCKISLFIHYLQDTEKINPFIFYPYQRYTYLVQKRYFVHSLNFINYIYFICTGLVYFFKKLYVIFFILNKIFVRKFSSSKVILNQKRDHLSLPKNSKEYSHYKIIYFPHKGISYGHLYNKFFYYNQDDQSHFYPNNILHIAIENYKEFLKKTCDSFNKKNHCEIQYTDLNQLNSEGVTTSLLKFIKILLLNRKKCFAYAFTFSISEIILFFKYFRAICYNLSALEKLTSVKLALVGYDSLFPPSLYFSLYLKKITVIAVQDRTYPIGNVTVDYHFVTGPEVLNFLQNRKVTYLVRKKSIIIGNIKDDAVKFCHEDQEENLWCQAIKQKHRSIIACLSINLPLSDEENRLKTACPTYRISKKIYIDIIKLSLCFKNDYFLIKGKDSSVLTHPLFEDIVEIITHLPNIEIVKDLEEITPEKLIYISDYCIGAYTSLIDEFLSYGKPTFIYDFFGMTTNQYALKYPEYLVATNYEDLYFRLERLLNHGEFLPEKDFEKLRKDFYNNSHTHHVHDKLQEQLEQLYDKYVS